MKTRDLITLYKLVLENVTTNLVTGICNVMTALYMEDEISREEFELLAGHFKSVPPPVKDTLGGYYFLPGLVEPRVKFLEEIIEKLTIEADKTTSLIRCYESTLEVLRNNTYPKTGICHTLYAVSMIHRITRQNRRHIHLHFISIPRPSDAAQDSEFYWPLDETGRKRRIQLIEEILKKLKNGCN